MSCSTPKTDDGSLSPAEQALRDAALEYHRGPTRGKISITPTKPLSNQRDLSLAYSPGVAYACLAIEADPRWPPSTPRAATWSAWSPTAPRCSAWATSARWPAKPVMEGKGCLFKKFAGIDVFDIELAEKRPRQAGRDHRRARAHAGRHQPRGHQGARVLLHREQAARADEHPGLPRRPARHRDHLRRRAAQRAGTGGQGHRRDQAGRSPAPARRPSPAWT